MAKSKKPRLVITLGDPDGIGPEVALSAAHRLKRHSVELTCVGSLGALAKAQHVLKKSIPSGLTLVPAPTRAPRGRLLSGYQAGWSIQWATQQVCAGVFDAMVTGPIDKSRLHRGGFRYPGHTEFIARLCGGKNDPTMMLCNDQMRVSLVTTHVGLAQVSRVLRPEAIVRAGRHTAIALMEWFGIKRPKIAIAALNPHAGEKGIFGAEEKTKIAPAIKKLRAAFGARASFSDPLPADTLFANYSKQGFDAVVCMYHDQGLIPVKLIDFSNTVNVSLGIPIIRTSVDHGTAFDLAGKGMADPSSMISAIRLATQLVEGKRK